MKNGAGDGDRTRDIQLGRLTLCQLSYSRGASILADPLERRHATRNLLRVLHSDQEVPMADKTPKRPPKPKKPKKPKAA
jgi:hypothetical protein